jgi:hypothetical protein
MHRLKSTYNARMRAEIFPLRTLLLSVPGWGNRHQVDAIAYLIKENKALKEQVGEG